MTTTALFATLRTQLADAQRPAWLASVPSRTQRRRWRRWRMRSS